MAHILYPDTPERPAFFINPHKMDPVKAYMKHYENWKYLKFIHDNTKNGMEKRQANKEIITATKKMDYWFGMFKGNTDLVKELEELKKETDKLWTSR